MAMVDRIFQRWPRRLLISEIIFFHLSVECRSAKAQSFRYLGQVAIVLANRRADSLLLQLDQVQGPRGPLMTGCRDNQEVIRTKLRAYCGNDRPLNGML